MIPLRAWWVARREAKWLTEEWDIFGEDEEEEIVEKKKKKSRPKQTRRPKGY